MRNLSIRRERKRKVLRDLEDAIDGQVSIGSEIEAAERGRSELHERPHEVFLSDRAFDPAADLAEERGGLDVVLPFEDAIEAVEQGQKLPLRR